MNTLHIYAAQYIFKHASSDKVFTCFTPPPHTHTHSTYTYNYVPLLFQISYLSHFPCLDKKQCNLLQTALISCFHNCMVRNTTPQTVTP